MRVRSWLLFLLSLSVFCGSAAAGDETMVSAPGRGPSHEQSAPAKEPVMIRADQEQGKSTQPKDEGSVSSSKNVNVGEEKAGAPEVHKLEEVVVSASRREMAVSDIPASVTIIDSKQLEDYPVKTVDDALRSIAGIDVWGSDLADQGFRSVTLRGVGGGNKQQRTLILLDGVPVNDTWSGWVAWGQVAKEDVERIEVVRGPFSSLYGPYAIGGVINIITKKPVPKPVGGETRWTYGEFNTWSGYGRLSGTTPDEKFGAYASGKVASSDGYLAAPEEEPNRSDNEFDLFNFYGQGFYHLDQHSYLRLSGGYLREERNRGHPFSNVDPREIDRVNLTYGRDVPDGLSWLGILYYQKEDQRVEFDDRITHSLLEHVEESEKPFYGVILQPSYPLADWNTLTVGGEFKYNEVTLEDTFVTSDREKGTQGKQEYYGLYFQDDMFFFDRRFILSVGARYDWWKSFDGATFDTNPPGFQPFARSFETRRFESFNPKLGATYHLAGDTTLRGSVGTGYRAPTTAEMYADLTRGLTLLLGNPDLDPEKILSYEVGVNHAFGQQVYLSLTLYQSWLDDLINNRTIERIIGPGPPRDIRQQDNISKVRAQGIELELQYNVTRELYGFLNYTFNESKIMDDDVDSTLEGNYLSNSPLNKLNLGLTYDDPEILTVGLRVSYVDDSYDDNENTAELDSYWTFDVKFARNFGKHVRLSFAIENLFDEEYDIPSFTTFKSPGRLWSLGLTLGF